jgi:CheY-like chemotaxis protein
MKTGCLKTLVIDDDAEHAQILREAAASWPVAMLIDAISDGEEALRYLRVKDRTPPDLIFLDLQLPGLDGFSVLMEIRRDARLRAIPVMVLSSAADISNVTRAYELGANLFFAKPLAFETYRDLIGLITRLWTRFAELPVAPAFPTGPASF